MIQYKTKHEFFVSRCQDSLFVLFNLKELTSLLFITIVLSFVLHIYLSPLGVRILDGVDDEFGEKTVSVLLDGEESEIVFIDHPSSEMSVSFLRLPFHSFHVVLRFSFVEGTLVSFFCVFIIINAFAGFRNSKHSAWRMSYTRKWCKQSQSNQSKAEWKNNTFTLIHSIYSSYILNRILSIFHLFFLSFDCFLLANRWKIHCRHTNHMDVL